MAETVWSLIKSILMYAVILWLVWSIFCYWISRCPRCGTMRTLRKRSAEPVGDLPSSPAYLHCPRCVRGPVQMVEKRK